MEYLLLFIAVSTSTIQSFFAKEYQKKVRGAPIGYAAMSAVAALCYFVVVSGFQLQFSMQLFWYSLLFAIAYCMGSLGLVVAIGSGVLSVTMLIFSYSLLIPTLYGIIFLKEKIALTTAIGFVLVAVSLFLVNYSGKSDKKCISLKWIIGLAFAFVGNGMAATFQKMQQKAMDGKYKDEFMIIALSIVVIVLFVAAFLTERKKKAVFWKKGWYFAVSNGVSNGITNYLVMVLGGMIPVSIMFPVMSAGGLAISSLASVCIYKEKLTKVQYMGVIIGLISIVLLNL